jgi:uncharacterized coiled-coil DUF342 family protein
MQSEIERLSARITEQSEAITLLDSESRKMKAERDTARSNVVHVARDCEDYSEANRRLGAEIERMRPVVEAACAWHRWASDPEPESDDIEPLENALDDACEAYQPVMPKPPIGGAS